MALIDIRGWLDASEVSLKKGEAKREDETRDEPLSLHVADLFQKRKSVCTSAFSLGDDENVDGSHCPESMSLSWTRCV